MTRCLLLLFLAALGVVPSIAQQPAMLPYNPAIITDEKGHEWYIEQNGSIQRNGSTPSMIGNCMIMQLGGQQFYTNQAMSSPDGKEVSMTSQQPMAGVSITRRITIMEREGALRYVDEFANTTTRDLTVNVEIRHSLNNTAREVTSNLGQPVKDTLEPDASAVLALPSEGESGTPALLFSVWAPGAVVPLKLRIQNKYQISMLHLLTIPAGQTQSLVHVISQVDVPAKADAAEITKICSPLLLNRFTKGLPKSVLKTAVNLGASSSGHDLKDWLPQEYWGITPGNSDQLALGKGSLLKGTAAFGKLTIVRQGGRVVADQEHVSAVAGPGFAGDGRGWVWLRDGQRWFGTLEAPELRFTLNSGAELPVTRLDRLVIAKNQEPVALSGPMIELWSGERIAVELPGNLQAVTAWGPLQVPWAEVIAWHRAGKETLGGMLHLRDGTRVRALPQAGHIRLKTRSLGEQEIDLMDMRRLITPLAAVVSLDEEEPTTSFLDLVADQRVVARVTDSSLTMLTEGGPLSLTPASIRELRDMMEDEGGSAARVFEAGLWGAGVVRGTLENTRVHVEGRGFGWDLATRQILRVVNPVPMTDHALMRRIGQLIQDLGSEQWKTREGASMALRELGPLARASLQEALKSATDAEVVRRLEELMQDQE